MYLDKVEIHGFKSFGNAVKLKIPQGITAIIGPNGSGKSNVSDAIRWVLGEQSAKSLRGTKMEDIIFAGTENRKSLGYAEVALTIKNDKQEANIDFHDIVVKRRVYRSGESEYFINGSSCRLKDVQEIFMDTGVGKEGYSIIGQGQIDRVLSSKPEDRRNLFEEAAGIYKYKVRKGEAEKKLEKQRENIVRVEDIISEQETRLGPLEIEAEKTTRFLELRDKLKTIDVNIAINEIDRFSNEIASLDKKINDISAEIDENEALGKNNEESLENLKRTRDDLFKELERLLEFTVVKEQEKERNQSEINLNKEKISNLRSLLEKVENEKEEQDKEHESKKEKLTVLETKKVALEIEKASKESIINDYEGKLNLIDEDIRSLEENIGNAKINEQNKFKELETLKANFRQSNNEEEKSEERKESLTAKINQYNSDIMHQEVSLKLLNKRRDETIEKYNTLKNEVDKLLNEKNSLLNKKDNLGQAGSRLKSQKAEVDRNISWLTNIKEQNEGYYQSVKQVLNVAKEAKMIGIIGVVGELLEVPQIYETAIVTALGGAMQNIVTESENDAKNMIRIMKSRGIARVTFLPIDTIRPASPINEKNLENEKGFLGVASSLVSYDVKYSNIISSILGRIIIVDNMDNASIVAKRYNYKYKIVTLDGEVFNAGGSLSGGSVKKQGNNIFARSRELKEALEKSKELTAEIQEVLTEYNSLDKQLEENMAKYEEKYPKLEALSTNNNTFILDIDKTTQNIELIKSIQLNLIEERSGIDDEIEKIKETRTKARETIQNLERELAEVVEGISAVEEELIQKRTEKDEVFNELSEKKVDLSTTVQNIEYMLEQIKDLQNIIEGKDDRDNKYQDTVKKYYREIEELAALVNESAIKIQENEKEIANTKERRNKLAENKEKLDVKEKELSESVSKINERLNLSREERYRLTSKRDANKTEKTNFSNILWEQYELTYSAALKYKEDSVSINDYKKQQVEIKSQIKQIGNVNVNAVTEFKEVKERYEFYTHQRDDMEKAAESLVEMIDKLVEEMKEIFKAQFAIIGRNFTEVFKELFGGGDAYLELVDPDNILESGIEIIAKPPGKKLQNMTLLSGGERTLTAISLIFGILKLKPSPFCILDEIEAALDDANVIRFANYLERLSAETQFIVITHRKGTMERAHTLYGVTMQERGVSTILSIQLGEVDKYIEKENS